MFKYRRASAHPFLRWSVRGHEGNIWCLIRWRACWVDKRKGLVQQVPLGKSASLQTLPALSKMLVISNSGVMWASVSANNTLTAMVRLTANSITSSDGALTPANTAIPPWMEIWNNTQIRRGNYLENFEWMVFSFYEAAILNCKALLTHLVGIGLHAALQWHIETLKRGTPT